MTDPWQTIAESKIQEAIEAGEFDNLEGFGRPLKFRDEFDPNWWLKAKAKQEQLNLLPPALLLARIVEREFEQALQCECKIEFQNEIERINRYVKSANLRITWGPASTTQPLDLELALQRWLIVHCDKSA